MKSIYLVRHSYAEYSYHKKDYERELTPEGYLHIETQIQLLKTQQKETLSNIGLFISSPAIRAKQTALTIKKSSNLDCKIIYYNWLYESYTTQDLIQLFQSIPEHIQSVVLVAHNPSISVMATNLNHSKNYLFSPCSILKIDYKVESWKNIDARGGEENFFLR